MFLLISLIYLISNVKFDKKNPSESLRLLVEDLENTTVPIESIPKSFVDYFTIPGLANSLNLQLPEPGAFNSTLVETLMESRTFKNVNELSDFIKKNFEYPLDRLYSIFYYAANNIFYDYESLSTNSIRYKTIDEIFESKLGVCGHFSLFMNEMSQKCDIRDIEISEYANYAKGVDPFSTPKKFEVNHASILVKINNSIFISDPTWASGCSLQKYHPSYFLNPIEMMIKTQYPADLKINFSFSYDQFKKTLPYGPKNCNFKVESHPFWLYECNDGYMNFQFSCNSNAKVIQYQLSLVNKTEDFYKYSNIETISSEKRKRFIIHLAFPKKGLFDLNIWIDGYHMQTYYIKNNKVDLSKVPLFSSSSNDCKFTPIEPKVLMTSTNSNYAILKFSSAKESHHRLIIQNDEDGIWYYSIYDEVQFALSDNLTEKWIMVKFDKNRVYQMKLLIDNNDDFKSPITISYMFKVSNKKHESIPSLESLIPKDKEVIKPEEHDKKLYENDKSYINIDGFINSSRQFLRKGKDILTSIDYERGEKKIIDIINNLQTVGKNAYDSIDINGTKNKIADLSTMLILISKEMYDSFDSESAKEKLKSSTNKIIANVNDFANNADSKNEKMKILEITESLTSYGKEVINGYDLEKSKEKIKNAANNLIDKGKQMYNDFDYEKTKQKVKDTVKDKYDQASRFFKGFFSKNEKESDL